MARNNTTTVATEDEDTLPVYEGYICGAVPREYLRQRAERQAAPTGVAQRALILGDLARREGLRVFYCVDEYNYPCDVSVDIYTPGGRRVIGIMIESCGGDNSRLRDGYDGSCLEEDLPLWGSFFRREAAEG